MCESLEKLLMGSGKFHIFGTQLRFGKIFGVDFVVFSRYFLFSWGVFHVCSFQGVSHQLLPMLPWALDY